MATTLGSQALESIVKITESGTAQEFFVSKHGYPTGKQRTLLVRRYIHSDRQWHTSNVNAYAGSGADTWLNGDYLGLLPADIQSQIAAVSIPYTPGNGNYTVGTLSRKVFLLSLKELNNANNYANAEGSALSIARTLEIAYTSTGSATTQWTRSPYTNNIGMAWSLGSTASPVNATCSNTHGVRPAFTLPSSLMVDDSGNVIVNQPPVISGSDGDLGTKSAGFTQTYTVTDQESDAVTVTEKINGAILRTFTPALGAANTFDVTGETFQVLLNGNNTLTVTADDGSQTVTRTWTFTKAVHALRITMENPIIIADGLITKATLNCTGSIPADAEFRALVTNNGRDANPAWEDATQAVRAGRVHVFEHTAYGNGHAFNFVVTAQRGLSGEGGNISTVGGVFATKDYIPLSVGTWAQIGEAAASGKARDYWASGDEKDITLTTGEVLTLQIYGLYHDDLADGSGKAPISFGLKDFMATMRQMNSTDTNVNGFTGSEMYSWLNGELYNLLPADLRALIKPVYKKTSAGNQSTTINTDSMKIFLFSEAECFDTITRSYAGEGSQYPVFTDAASRIKSLPGYNYWWLRSPMSGSPSRFCVVDSAGGIALPLRSNASTAYGVCFGFCI